MKYLHKYICHIRDSSTTKSKQSVCDIFSSRQQDAVIMRHFNYSPDKYMVSISNNYSLTILWMIQINSEKIIPHHVLPSEWFPWITKNKRQDYHSQILCPLFTLLFTAYWRPNNRKSVFQGNKPGGFFILFANLHGLWFMNNCSWFSLVQVMFYSVGHPLPHSILSKPPAPTPYEHIICQMILFAWVFSHLFSYIIFS